MKFYHRSEWENDKMFIILKTDVRRAKGIKFGTRRYRNSYIGYFFMSDSFSSIWDHSVHFATFPISRLLFSSNFSQKLQKALIRKTQAVLLSGDLQKKVYGT